jgi:hypothetical protein
MRVCQFRHFGKWTIQRGGRAALKGRDCDIYSYKARSECQTHLLAGSEFGARQSRLRT